MGKKQISQLTFFDYVCGISIGSIAAAFAVEDNVNYTRGITGLIVYAAFPILLSLVSLKSYLNGTPTILIQNGRISERSLTKTRMSVNDLLIIRYYSSISGVSEKMRHGSCGSLRSRAFSI